MRHIRRSILLLICLTVLCASFVGAQEKRSDELFRIIVDGKYGFINRIGKVVIEPKFESVGKFSEGLAPVYFYNPQAEEKHSTGFINENGEFVIKPISGSASEFSDGVSIIGFDVRAIPGSYPKVRFGVIDKSGKIIIGPNFIRIFPFKDELAYAVTNDGKEGFIDKTGKIIFAKRFNYLGEFSDDLALVVMDEKYGYIDKTSELVITPQFTHAQHFSEGLAAVTKEGKFYNTRQGFVLKKGEKRTRKYSYIDTTGKIIFSIETELAYPFSEGFAAIHKNGNYGFIDKTGKLVIKPQFGSGTSHTFSEGLCKVFLRTDKGSELAYIDKTGKVVIKPNFDNGGDFNNGLAEVYKGAYPNATSTYIDRTGKIIWQYPK